MNQIILDNFVDSDGVSISSHLPNIYPSTLWTQTASNSFQIKSNSLQPNRFTDGDIAVIDAGKCDFTVSVETLPYGITGNISYAGLVFRYQDTNNFWYVFGDSINSYIRIYKVVGGVSTPVISYGVTVLSQVTLLLKIKCKDDNITLFVNDQEIVTVTDQTFQNASLVGVRCGKSGSPSILPQWNNFSLIPFDGLELNWPIFTEYTSNPIVTLGSGGSWEDSDVNDPNVIFDPIANRYALFYSGYRSEDGNSQQSLGAAYSQGTKILSSWTKESKNPVFGPNGGFDSQNGGIIYFKGLYYYYYGTNSARKISLATSTDLINWTNQGIVLDAGATGNWDVNGVFDAFARVRQDGKTIELWYGGFDVSNNRQIGMATSTDGLNFAKNSNNPIIPLLPWENNNTEIGEPSVYVPPGKEGKEYLISHDGVDSLATINRFISQSITIDGGKTWHHRIKALEKSGSDWESQQVFDSFMMVVNNIMYLFHAGSNTASGSGLGINIEIGIATAPFPYKSLDAANNLPSEDYGTTKYVLF